MSGPDPGLLAAVERAVRQPGEPPEASIPEATAALAAVGRALANLVHERETDIHRAQNDAVQLPRYAELLAAQAAALGELADVWLPRWCGVDAEGEPR